MRWINKKIDPKQLEQKYQGEAQNLTEFWPPRAPWNDYGIYEENLLPKISVDKNDHKDTYNGIEINKDNQSIEAENVVIKMQNELNSKSINNWASPVPKKKPIKKEWKWVIF